jgi:antitoxin ParD1/3/4
MRSTQALSITLPLEMAKMVKDKVRSGEYATESEVVRDGLRMLSARDAAIEKWLVEEVVPTMENLKAGRSRTKSLDEAREFLHSRIDELMQKRSGE